MTPSSKAKRHAKAKYFQLTSGPMEKTVVLQFLRQKFGRITTPAPNDAADAGFSFELRAPVQSAEATMIRIDLRMRVPFNVLKTSAESVATSRTEFNFLDGRSAGSYFPGHEPSATYDDAM